ncbi:transporter [uncultured Campylobacter sp.]|uniref:transporter n=1 Tax=uncultured Campylobacter sp. TaxID=218934 RepID=UPI002635B626|nr:transporter [uncultured Campylobacter sp.]
MKRDILIAVLGLLCAFIDINYIGFLIALNLIVVLVCAAFPFMKKNYIFFLLLIVNLALYFNAIDTPFEKPELWTYSIPALANATYVLVALVYASGFVAFVPLAAYICFLYSLCAVACGIREKFQSLR